MIAWMQEDLRGTTGCKCCTIIAGCQHNAHDAGFADKSAVSVAVQHCRREARLKSVKLGAGVPQARHFYYGGRAEVQPGSSRQAEQVYAPRRDVLAHVPCRHAETGGLKLVVQFCVDQMHLAQVRL